MWIVKLGGSLGRDPLLPRWLELLAELGAGRGIVVPGGGGFADQGREAQAWWGIDDLAAHNIAVLGMAQMASLMKGLCPALEVAHDEAQLQAVLHRGRTALWLPLDLLREQPDELTHWGVSSDSLALRLALRLRAERLVIVKSCAIDRQASLDQLVEAGVLDAAFAGWARGAALSIDLMHKEERSRARLLLQSA